jgi:hypothetical protein
MLLTERSFSALSRITTTVMACHSKPMILDDLAIVLDWLLTTAFPLCHPGYSATTKTKKRKRRTQNTSCVVGRLDTLLGSFTMTLLVPLVRSFSTLSLQYTATLKPSGEGTAQRKFAGRDSIHSSCDTRPHVLKFAQEAINSLQRLATIAFEAGNNEIVSSIQGVYEVLMINIASELETLCDDSPGYKPSNTSPTAQRDSVHIWERLALKDSLWYLCGLMHVIIPSSIAVSAMLPDTSESAVAKPLEDQPILAEESVTVGSLVFGLKRRKVADGLLHGLQPMDSESMQNSRSVLVPEKLRRGTCSKSVLTSLSRLVQKISRSDKGARKGGRKACVFGEVERSMVLGLVENLWLSG